MRKVDIDTFNEFVADLNDDEIIRATYDEEVFSLTWWEDKDRNILAIVMPRYDDYWISERSKKRND